MSIFWVIVGIYILYKYVKRLTTTLNPVFDVRTPHALNSENIDELIGRYQPHLDKMLNSLSTQNTQSYYVDNNTIDFMKSILQGNEHSPKPREYYRDWIRKPTLPATLKRFAMYANEQIQIKYDLLSAQEKANKIARNELNANTILDKNSEKIAKFLEIAYRKVSAVDDYGDENPKALNEETLRFFKKISDSEPTISSELKSIKKDGDFYRFSEYFAPTCTIIAKKLASRFSEYYADQKTKSLNADTSDIEKMTGVEFEQYLILQLKKFGATKVSGTATTGDQGADILFSFDTLSVVIQAKRYGGSVGNKAVQEVHAAKGMYKCDRAWVITNSTFTRSARQLARELDVFLIDGTDLKRLEHKFREYFLTANEPTG